MTASFSSKSENSLDLTMISGLLNDFHKAVWFGCHGQPNDFGPNPLPDSSTKLIFFVKYEFFSEFRANHPPRLSTVGSKMFGVF